MTLIEMAQAVREESLKRQAWRETQRVREQAAREAEEMEARSYAREQSAQEPIENYADRRG